MDRAISGSFSHHYVRVSLAGSAVGAVALPFTIHSGEDYYSVLRTKVGRDLSFAAVLAGNLMLVVPHILKLYVWWQAFRRQPAETCAADEAGPARRARGALPDPALSSARRLLGRGGIHNTGWAATV